DLLNEDVAFISHGARPAEVSHDRAARLARQRKHSPRRVFPRAQMHGAGTPVKVLKAEGPESRDGQAHDDRGARCPHGVERSNDAKTWASWSSCRDRGSVDNRHYATVGMAASSRSAQNPSTRRNRRNDRSAVWTVLIDRGQ